MKSWFILALLGTGFCGGALAADVAKGKASYAMCAACHGANAEGNQATGAPKLAGQSSWYMITQLKNFKAGIRGTHPEDTWGQTMRPMAMTLATDADIENVVAYIETL